MLKRLFPNASASLLAANTADYGSGTPQDGPQLPAKVSLTVPVARDQGNDPERADGLSFTVWGNPVGKPRMTQRDKWAKRPAVLKYRAWADKAREAATLPADPSKIYIVAYFSMPKSWPKWKKEMMANVPHREKPDWDNVAKACCDALFPEDKKITHATFEKWWDDGKGARVEITVL